MAIINGTTGDDVLFALAAGDILNGLDGNDLLITEGIHFTTFNAGAGDDNLWLTTMLAAQVPAEHNVLNGGDGNDVFGGTGNANVLNGDAGDDRFEITGNGNILNGGIGNDTVGVTDDATFYVAGDGNILSGGDGDDSVGVRGNANTLNGDAGHDLLAIAGSGNTLNGGAGHDQFYADTGDGNTLNGGEGNDVFSGINFNGNTFNGGEGDDYASAAVANNSTLNGGGGNDHLAVGGDNNTLDGGGGNDYLEAFDSDQPGTNVLMGGEGDDILTVFYGGRLTGGAGSDRFDIIHTGADTVITDFEHASSRNTLQPEDVLNVEVWQTFELGAPVDKSLKALVGQGYLAVDASTNVGGDSAMDTVVHFDTDGRAGPSASTAIVTLLDTTLTTYGADMNNWLV